MSSIKQHAIKTECNTSWAVQYSISWTGRNCILRPVGIELANIGDTCNQFE